MTRFPQDDLGKNFSKFRDLEAVRHEEGLVSAILTRFRLSKYKSDVLDISEKTLGVRQLKLDAFCELFDTFPYYLATRTIKGVTEDVRHQRLFSAFGNSKIIKEYDELLSSCGGSRSVGMIFPWPGIVPGMILHDHPFDTGRDGVRLFWTHNGSGLTMEPVKSWLQYLDWGP